MQAYSRREDGAYVSVRACLDHIGDYQTKLPPGVLIIAEVRDTFGLREDWFK
jgi:hypothetical protein